MVKILSFDTSTAICSVALSEDTNIISFRESREGKNHALLLATFIDEMLRENSLKASDLDAVAFTEGPGSYTGLRIGVSTAKGIAYGISKPLISLPTLLVMAKGYIDGNPDRINSKSLLCPMIDARRMEVYSAIYNHNLSEYRKTKAEIIEHDSFSEVKDDRNLILFGDGALKCRDILKKRRILIDEEFSISAKAMVSMAYSKYRERSFADIAYFEPFYLKDFVATIPKNKML